MAGVEALHGRRARERSVDVRVDTGPTIPSIGDSFSNLARYGLELPAIAEQRTLRAKLRTRTAALRRCRRRSLRIHGAPERSQGFSTASTRRGPAVQRARRVPEPEGPPRCSEKLRSEIEAAGKAFAMADPSAAAPSLARGLAATRRARTLFAAHPDAVHVLHQDTTVRGRHRRSARAGAVAVAVPRGRPSRLARSRCSRRRRPWPPVVPGQGIDVRVSVTARHPGNVSATLQGLAVNVPRRDESPLGPPSRTLTPVNRHRDPPARAAARLRADRPHVSRPRLPCAVHRGSGVGPAAAGPTPALPFTSPSGMSRFESRASRRRRESLRPTAMRCRT